MLERYRGLLVIVLWQAPVGPAVQPDGSISVLLGGGYDELTDFSCDGPDVSRSVGYATLAVEGEHDVGERGRVEVVAGGSVGGESSHTGAFVAGRIRADWTWGGAGLGIGVARGVELSSFGEGDLPGYVPLPSLYLRVGSREGAHARGDVFPPSAMFAQQQARVGLGWNATQRDRASAFVGIGTFGLQAEGTGVVADFVLPLDERMGFRLNGHYAPGRENAITGLSAGGTYLLR